MTSLYQIEQSRLLGALGPMLEGGVVEHIELVGAAAILDDPAQVLEIAIAAWPFPLEEPARFSLQGLGYQLAPGYEGEPEMRFSQPERGVVLFISAAGGSIWSNHLLLRDYLRDDLSARQAYAALRPAWQDPAYEKFFAAMLPGAEDWWIQHTGFSPLAKVATELQGCGFPWYFSSGWALDLFLGRVTRLHHDVDIVLDYTDQFKLRQQLAGRGWQFLTPYEKRLSPWPEHMRLEPPRHQLHAHRGSEFIDCLLSHLAGDAWRYRRQPHILRHTSHVARTSPEGWTYLAPELVLLFKSVNTSGLERGKDQRDFEKVLPALAAEPRAWLRWAILATTPEHPWLALL